MANTQTSSNKSSDSSQRPGTQAATGKKADPAPPAAAAKTNTKPWEDLPANPALQKTPREKTTLAVVLELTKQENGATEDEIRAAFGTKIAPHMTSHEPRGVMRFMSKNRGWGFHMIQSGPNAGRIKLVTK